MLRRERLGALHSEVVLDVGEHPIGIGAQVVQAAYDAANGDSVDEFYDTGSYWYDSTNLEDDKIAAVLYE